MRNLLGIGSGLGHQSISDCYVNGNVSGENWVGGLVGDGEGTHDDSVSDCYFIGNVSGVANVGAFIGNAIGVLMTSSYWNETSDDGPTVGCWAGTGCDVELENKALWELKKRGTFVLWNFSDTWGIIEDEMYPFLKGTSYVDYYGLSDDNLIYNFEDLNATHDDLAGDYLLMANIDLAGKDFEPIGHCAVQSGSPICIGTLGNPAIGSDPFTGVFNGNGYTIRNFEYTTADGYGIGFFGFSHGNIRHLHLSDVDIHAVDSDSWGGNVGGLVGYMIGGKVFDSSVSGNVRGRIAVGGLIGTIKTRPGWSVEVTNCSSDVEISGTAALGGFVGQIRTSSGSINTIIRECKSLDSNVNILDGFQVPGESGGFAGLVSGGAQIVNSYTNANVDASGVTSGGFAGYTEVGGFVGEIYNGFLTNVYSTGNLVDGYKAATPNIGGFAGLITNPTIVDSYWDNQIISGYSSCGSGACTGATGHDTATMKLRETYTPEWDFENVWNISEGVSYPYLLWEI